MFARTRFWWFCSLSAMACSAEPSAPSTPIAELRAEVAALGKAKIAADAERAAMQTDIAELRASLARVEARLDREPEVAKAPEPAIAPPSVAEPAPSDVDTATAIAKGVHCDSPSECTVEWSLLQRLLADPTDVAIAARIVPHTAADGTPAGFRLSAIQAGSLFEALGLENGDIIGAVNGKPLASVEDAMALYSGLRRETAFVLGLARKGKARSLAITILGRPAAAPSVDEGK